MKFGGALGSPIVATGVGVKSPPPQRLRAGNGRGGVDRCAARTMAELFAAVGCARRCCPATSRPLGPAGAAAPQSGAKKPQPRRPQAVFRRGHADRCAARTIAGLFESVGWALRCFPASSRLLESDQHQGRFQHFGCLTTLSRIIQGSRFLELRIPVYCVHAKGLHR